MWTGEGHAGEHGAPSGPPAGFDLAYQPRHLQLRSGGDRVSICSPFSFGIGLKLSGVQRLELQEQLVQKHKA